MSALLGPAIALTRAWTATYTRGLPAELRAQRREEIDCDLWEQQRLAELGREPEPGTAAQVVARLLLGVPADILWRLEAGANARTAKETAMNEPIQMRVFLALAVVLAGLLIASGVGNLVFLAGDWEEGSGTFQRLYGLAVSLAGGGVILGLLLAARRPNVGFWMTAISIVCVNLLMFWVFFLTVPIGIAVMALASKRAYGSAIPWRRQAPRLA